MSKSRKSNKIFLIVALAVILVLGPLVYFGLIKPHKSTAAWFDDGWHYRTAINITNSGAADANKKVKFDIDTATLYSAGKIKINCDDSRFTDANGKLLQYFLDSANGACNTNSTDYYVLVPTINSGTTTIYHYYGNVSAAKGSENAQFSQATFSQASTSIQTEEISKAPIAYWSFDEGSGITVHDSSSNQNNGTLGSGSSAPSWQTEDMCVAGKCLKFDGNDYVNSGSNSSLNFGTGNFSIGGWFKAKPGNTTRAIASKNPDNITWWRIQIQTDGTLNFQFDDNIVKYSWTSTSRLDDNNWHHFSITRGSAYEIYIDGKSQNANGTINASTLTNSGNLLIGGDIKGNYFFDGFIDEVKIYPYARSASEIKADYNAGKSGASTSKGTSASLGGSGLTDSLSNGLVGYWKMDETSWSGVAGEVIDSSGNGNNGQGVGATKPTTGAGKFGNGGVFDGISQYAQVTETTSTDFDKSQGTISLWVKSADFSVTGKQQTFFDTTGNRMTFAVQPDGDLFFYPNVSDSGSNYNLVTNPLTDNVWNHVTVTWNLSKKSAIIYVNGEIKSLATNNVPTYWTTAANTTNLRLAIDGNTTNPFNGLIDEVRIYNRALSPAEVADLYNWAPGPAAYYDFEDAGGQAVTDKSGNGNNGTLGTGNSAPTWATGKYGKGLRFDGIKTYVDIEDNDTIDLTNDEFTTESWIYRYGNGFTTAGYIFSKSDGGSTNHQYGLYYTNAGAFCYVVMNTSACFSSPGILNNKWYHVALTYKKSASEFKLYLNGVLTETDTVSTDITSTSSKLHIGCRGENTTGINHPFDGLIDEVKIYNYARTQKQIVEDMNAGHPVGGSPVGTELAYYKFDEGYGNTANNSGNGGSNLNGTLGPGNSAPVWTSNGKFGKALSFNGVSSYFSKADNDSLDMRTGDFSAFAWIKAPSATAQHDVIIDKGGTSAGSVGYWFSLETNGTLQLFISDGSSYIVNATSNVVVGDSSWHRVGFTWNPSLGAKFYIDGKLDKVVPASTSVDFNSGSSFFIGGYSSNGFTINGLIDEVKIYNYALTDEEIAIDYNQGSALQLGTKAGNTAGTGNTAPSSASSQVYCVPGDTSYCTAPVAEWNFEEGIGSTAYDTSGNGNNGTLGTGNSAPSWVTGKIGKGLRFDGNNDYITVTDNSIYKPANSITIQTWVNFSNVTDLEGMIVGSNSSSNRGWALWAKFNSQNALVGQIGDDTNNYYLNLQIPKTEFEINKWYHITLTFNGSIGRMYINSQEKDNYSRTTSIVYTGVSGLTIGKREISANYFNGFIDQVRVYDYARSPAQIAWDYNKGAPIAHYKLDECQGTTIHNSQFSNSNLDGTLTVGPSGSQTSQGTCALGIGSSSAWGNGATGKYNSSLNFDGTDDSVIISANNLFGFSNNFSVSLWAKVNAYPTTDEAWLFDKSGNYSLVLDETGYLGYLIYYATSGYTYPVNLTTINLNEWTNIIMAVDSNNHVHYYKNGIKTREDTLSDYVKNSLTAVEIGRRASHSSEEPFNGQVDNVQIFNYALTSEQVKLLYNQGAVYFGD